MDFSDSGLIQRNLPGQLADRQIDHLKTTVASAGEGKDKDSEKLRSLSKQFESIMTHQLLSAMRATVPKSELLGGFSTDMYQSMMDQEIANEMSKQKGLGLADMIYRQLLRADQKAKNIEPPTGSSGLPAAIPANTGLPMHTESNAAGFPLSYPGPHDLGMPGSTGVAGSMIKAVKSYRGNQ